VSEFVSVLNQRNGRASVTPLSISNAASGQRSCATRSSALASDSSQSISINPIGVGRAPGYDSVLKYTVFSRVNRKFAKEVIVMFRRYFNDYLHGPQFSAPGRTDSRRFKIKQKRLNPIDPAPKRFRRRTSPG
jgi:hypothetical protein